MASGASALELTTLAPMVNRNRNVPMSSVAYFRPAVGPTTSVTSGGASGPVSVTTSMTSRVVSQRPRVVRANAHLRSRRLDSLHTCQLQNDSAGPVWSPMVACASKPASPGTGLGPRRQSRPCGSGGVTGKVVISPSGEMRRHVSAALPGLLVSKFPFDRAANADRGLCLPSPTGNPPDGFGHVRAHDDDAVGLR
jgi:hypothetical protein